MSQHTKMLVRSFVTMVGAVSMIAALAGCKTDALANPKIEKAPGPTTSLDSPTGVKVPEVSAAGRDELDLVEEMMMHRAMYARLLHVLATYYTEHGYTDKATWAMTELNDLKRVKPYDYISDAATPVSTLKPKDSIPAANQLFQEGVDLMKKGGHGVPIFYNQETMKQALAKFNELVDTYPTSDKIAEAAFYIGEIHKEYFEEKDNTISLLWYKRAIDWDPKVSLPARFQMAVVYDFRLHNRDKALYWYQEVLDKEQLPNYKSNVGFSKRRIKELTPVTTHQLPTEPEPKLQANK
jgi:tetratricopeptide (TPR) repeat protein